MKKFLFNMLYFIPLAILLAFYFYIIMIGMKIKLLFVIPFLLMIFLMSIFFRSKDSNLRRIGLLIALFFLGFCAVVGYYDYFRWTTTIISLAVLLYFFFLDRLDKIK